ncbi:unnamed protein product [Rotaria socialis]|uniref:Uncharacterized protein n=1 Tax=Rotaria socialis TaxID=392032 RepID=A0A821W9H9_9BILA|nr:unnamed protein product [Rotaria socialis]
MPNFVQTQQYESSSESDDTMDQQNVPEKTKIKPIKREEQWSRYFTNKVQDGVKVQYRCNNVKFCGTQCNAVIYLFYPHNSDEVILFRANNEHNILIQELFDMRLAKDVPLGEKRKRGRPRKATQALLID